MNILVTGATGRVGSRFVPRLLRRRSEAVRVLVRDPARAEPLGRLGAEIVVGDLRDPGTLGDALKGTDVVVHLAAAFRGVSDDETTATNHTATVELAEAAIRAGVGRFVHVGTTLIYGSGHGRPAAETDEPVAAERAYPASKVAAENDLMRLHRERGLPLSVARLAFVYGDGDPHLAESLMWAGEWPMHKRLHMVHHADVAQALLRLIEAKGVEGSIYNVADDAPVTALELHALNRRPIPGPAASRTLDDPWDGIADTTKIRRELGFRPIYPTVHTAADAGAL
jgi:nucleoside-diphosphate-sugar epimerase